MGLRSIDEAIVNKIGKIPIVNELRQEVSVPVFCGTPQDWLARKRYPSINVHRLPKGVSFDRSRFIPHPTHTKLLNGDYLKVPYKFPFTVLYGIDFICKYREDFNYLLETLLKIFPPLGFNTQIDIGGDLCPFEIIEQEDLTGVDYSIDYRYVITIQVDAWLDVGESTVVPQILKVITETNTM